MTGWIGEHPQGRGSVAHLLLHPHGDEQAAGMRRVAGLLGLTRADQAAGMPDVPAGTALASLDQLTVSLRYGDAAMLSRPVSAEWAAVAQARRWVILTVGTDGLTQATLSRLDRYLARAGRVYLGRVRLGNDGSPPPGRSRAGAIRLRSGPVDDEAAPAQPGG